MTTPPTLGVSVGDTASVVDTVGRLAGIRLDICCGANKQGPGWFGIDIQPLPGVDLVWDVTNIPWPLPDESVLVAMASHVVEHIPPANFGFIRFMNEVWRLMKPGGEFAIVTPHGRSDGYIQDPTHVNPCNEATFLYFDQDHPLWTFYKPLPWKIKYIASDPAINIEVVLIKDELHHE